MWFWLARHSHNTTIKKEFYGEHISKLHFIYFPHFDYKSTGTVLYTKPNLFFSTVKLITNINCYFWCWSAELIPKDILHTATQCNNPKMKIYIQCTEVVTNINERTRNLFMALLLSTEKFHSTFIFKCIYTFCWMDIYTLPFSFVSVYNLNIQNQKFFFLYCWTYIVGSMYRLVHLCIYLHQDFFFHV